MVRPEIPLHISPGVELILLLLLILLSISLVTQKSDEIKIKSRIKSEKKGNGCARHFFREFFTIPAITLNPFYMERIKK